MVAGWTRHHNPLAYPAQPRIIIDIARVAAMVVRAPHAEITVIASPGVPGRGKLILRLVLWTFDFVPPGIPRWISYFGFSGSDFNK